MANQYPFIAGDFATLRASHSQVVFDGGAFLLHLAELRKGIQGGPANAFFEVGRFALPPAALQNLLRNIEAAIGMYEKAMGHPMPDPTKFESNVAISGLEDRIRPPSE